MTEKYNDHIKLLIGKKCTDVGLCADMLWIAFGDDAEITSYKGEKIKKSEYALDIQCPWRFLQHEENAGSEPRKLSLRTLAGMLPATVVCASVDSCADVTIVLSNRITIQIFSTAADNSEEWRFIDNINLCHMVYPEENE